MYLGLRVEGSFLYGGSLGEYGHERGIGVKKWDGMVCTWNQEQQDHLYLTELSRECRNRERATMKESPAPGTNSNRIIST